MDADLVLATDLPPILNIGVLNDFGNHRLEFVYERTFWGSAKIFEFGYSNQVFDKSNLKETGASFVNPEQMLGAADYSAVAYGNGWKDANAYMFGLGYRKKLFKDSLDLGISYSLALKDNRKSFIVSHDGFGQLHLFTIGAKYIW